jgi:hypothetical protein
MKIESYDVTAASERNYQSIETFTQTTNLSTGASRSNTLVEAIGEGPAAQAELSDAVKRKMEETQQNNQKTLEKSRESLPKSLKLNNDKQSIDADTLDLKIRLLEQMIYALTGKRINFKNIAADLAKRSSGSSPEPGSGGSGTVLQAPGRSAPVSVETERMRYESESTSYTAQGVIKTADGKTVHVDIEMNMSREFMSYTKTTVQAQLCDPIVINYGGKAASLRGEKFSFDLNMDGSEDQISFVGADSGFLALDRNGDGIINDGSELFGPQSGNGFSELRGYDSDGNGWIDENDEIYSMLRVWSKDKDGSDQLFTLKELDIGAMYLGEIETEFSMKDSGNNTQGVVRSTSFYLKDSGGAGTVNHIDLSL